MISDPLSRLRHAFGEYGVANTFLFGVHRILQKLTPTAVFERLYIVAQPVPAAAAAPAGRRGASIEVRSIRPGDPALATFTRIPDDLSDRYTQNASCLGAFRAGELLGWLWFVPRVFRDYEHPITFYMHPANATAWDFDIYVRPEARLSATFARLWEAAFQALRELGVTHTLSAISAYNPASLGAHRRLGTRSLGSILVVRIGRFQAVFARPFRPRLQWSVRSRFQAALTVDAPDNLSL